MDEFSISINPLNFFSFEIDCYRYLNAFTSQHTLPDLSLISETSLLANISLGWSSAGLHFQIEGNQAYEMFICIDTRNQKSTGFPTRYCHTFQLSLQPGEEPEVKEVTKFRSEDRHDLCFSEDLLLKYTTKKNGSKIELHIPSNCLYGYDPQEISKMGFTYHIEDSKGNAQDFSVTSSLFHVDQVPSQWSTLKFIP